MTAANIYTLHARTLSASAIEDAPAGPMLLPQKLMLVTVLLTCGRARRAKIEVGYRGCKVEETGRGGREK